MGLPQNLKESYKWFALAAKAGDTDAGKKRDEVGNAMVPKELEEARLTVSNWKPQKLDEVANRVSVPKEWTGKSGASAGAVAGNEVSVKNAQIWLNQRGYKVGTPDGVMGPRTRNAILEFQKNAGLPATGKVDAKLIEALRV